MSLLFFKSGIDVELLKINILWIVPFVWINLITFIIAKNIRGYYVSLGAISFWILLVSILFKNEYFIQKIMYINMAVYMTMVVVGIYLYYMALKKYMKTEVKDFQYEE